MPKSGDEVEIDYFFKSCKIDRVDIRENFQFILGRNELLAPIESEIYNMSIGEKKNLKIKISNVCKSPGEAYAMGFEFDDEISGDVTLVSFQNTSTKANSSILPQSEIITIAFDKKEHGNACVKNNEFENAKIAYNEAISVLKDGTEWEGSAGSERRKILLNCYSNLSLCHLNDSEYSTAIESATKAIEIDNKNVKALFRRASAFKNFGEFEKAKKDLINAARQEPQNRTVREMLEDVKKFIASSDLREKNTLSKMWKKIPCDVKVSFEIAIDEKFAGTITFELFSSFPKTVENFLTHINAKHYEFCGFHKLVKGQFIQGGDFEFQDGSGGFASEDKRFFDDESLEGKHSERGILSMANSGPNTNSSQFFITFSAQPRLDGKHVVFGKMIDGWNVLDAIEQIEVDDLLRPITKVDIRSASCLD